MRRGNPTGENHLSHSRASKRAKAEEEEASSPDETVTPSEPSQPPSAFVTTTTFDGLDLHGLDLQSRFADAPQGFEQPARHDESRKPKTSRNSSDRTSMGAIPASTFESNGFGFSTGHVTPDSVNTSGAATPFAYHHESRSHQLSPEDQLAIGSGLPAHGRPALATSYSTGSLPRILGQPNGRGIDLDWTAHSQFMSHDDYGYAQYHSGSVTPQHTKEELAEFLNQPNLTFPK